MDEKIALAIALFRFRIIAPALDKNLVEQKNYFAIQAEKMWEVPHYGGRKYTAAAFKSWLCDYRKAGLEALKPSQRSDTGQPRKIPHDLAERITSLAAEMEEATVSYLYRQLSSQKIINPPWLSESALRRFVKARDLLSTKTDPVPRKKYEKEHVNQLWISDFMHGPQVSEGKRKRAAILCDCIDDHSRVIVGSQWSFSENTVALELMLKSAINRFGVPQLLYVDNGAAFSTLHLQVACARLGIVLIHSKPYDSPSRGKIERFHRTVRLKFLPGLALQKIDSIEALNDCFEGWLRTEYHRSLHAGIGTTPLDRWDADIAENPPRYLSAEELFFAFYQTFKRKVKNDSTISVNAKLWQVPPSYIGKTIEVRHPSDLPMDLYLFENNKPVCRLHLCNAAENATSPAGAIRFADPNDGEDNHD
jgi:transposase InsO family protein